MAVARHLLRPTRKLERAALKRFPIWSCTGWGLPSFPGHPGNWCALTAPFHPYPGTIRRRPRGGMLSVALSFALPRLLVKEHPALRCSDFPPNQNKLIQRSYGLLRPFIVIFPINNSMAARAILEGFKPLEFVIPLGGNSHVTSQAYSIFYPDDCG